MRAYIPFLKKEKKIEEIIIDLKAPEALSHLVEDILYDQLSHLIKYGYFHPDLELQANDKAFDWLVNLPYAVITDISKILDEIYLKTLTDEIPDEDERENLQNKIEALTAIRKVGLSKNCITKLLNKNIEKKQKLRLSLLLTKLEGKALDAEQWERRIDLTNPESQYLVPVLISIYKKSDPFKALLILSELAKTSYVPPEEFLRFYHTCIRQAIFLALNPVAFNVDEITNVIEAAENRLSVYKRFLDWFQNLETPWALEVVNDIMEHPKFEKIKLLIKQDFGIEIGEQIVGPPLSPSKESKREYVDTIIKQSKLKPIQEISQFVAKLLKDDDYWQYGLEKVINQLPGIGTGDFMFEKYGTCITIFLELYDRIQLRLIRYLKNINYEYDSVNGILSYGSRPVRRLKSNGQIESEIERANNTGFTKSQESVYNSFVS
ncbi:MAG: hypothetical protein DHS20C18_14200 [Saprospiraceae bacterium]|nr:MAG: hypothetical protein DHS20C18_14200 [Saprospiraceae bacterium]